MALAWRSGARYITDQFEKLGDAFRSATLLGGARSNGSQVYGYEHAVQIHYDFTFGQMSGKAGDFLVRIRIPDWGDEAGYRIVSKEGDHREHERLSGRKVAVKRIHIAAHMGSLLRP